MDLIARFIGSTYHFSNVARDYRGVNIHPHITLFEHKYKYYRSLYTLDDEMRCTLLIF